MASSRTGGAAHRRLNACQPHTPRVNTLSPVPAHPPLLPPCTPYDSRPFVHTRQTCSIRALRVMTATVASVSTCACSPCVLRQQHLEVCLRLLHTLAAAQSPPLRQPAKASSEAHTLVNIWCVCVFVCKHQRRPPPGVHCHITRLPSGLSNTTVTCPEHTCVCVCRQGRRGDHVPET